LLCEKRERVAVIEKLTPLDSAILLAAVVMAVGAFCPIVHLPIIGSINYVMGGRGDGIYVVGCAAAIIGLVIAGYRRTAGIVAAGALLIMTKAIIGMSPLISKAHVDLGRDAGPFKGLGNLLANSVGLEWGWLLLIGGALAVMVLTLSPLGTNSPIKLPQRQQTEPNEEVSFASADQKIAEYLENRSVSPAIRNQSTDQQPAFGRRRSF
jgi:hypothetical protein